MSLYRISAFATAEGRALQGVVLVLSGVEQDVGLSVRRCLQLTDVGYPPDTRSCFTSNLLSYHGSFFVFSLFSLVLTGQFSICIGNGHQIMFPVVSFKASSFSGIQVK